MVAAEGGHTETIDRLIWLGADVNAPDRRGETPKVGAAETGQSDAVELLEDLIHEKQLAGLREAEPTPWDFFYWSDTYRNDDGESLLQRLDRHGVGGEVGDGKQLAVIYVSGARSLKNSWPLGVKFTNAETGQWEQVPTFLYETEPRICPRSSDLG